MMDITTFTAFLGWCTVLNLCVIVLFFVFISALKDWTARTMARVFGVTDVIAREILLRVFMQYRVAFAVLNLVPYLALRIIL